MKSLHKFRHGLDTVLSWVCALLFAAMVIGSVLAGAIWAFVPAWFKSRWNTNETLFTLMLNYIAMQLVSFAIVFWENPKGSNHVGLINSQSKAGWLPSIGTNGYLLPILISLLFSVMNYDLLRPLGSMRFAGLDNFRRILTGREFPKVLLHTFTYLALYLPCLLYTSPSPRD